MSHAAKDAGEKGKGSLSERESPAERYRWVEFAARKQRGFRNNVVRLEQIPELVEQYHAYGCYASAFLFTEELRDYANRSTRGKSVAGYDGSVYAHYLPMDIDAPDLEEAREAALEILEYVEGLGFDDSTALVYFSGSKGFHITLYAALFGDLMPDQHLHELFAELRQMIARDAGDKAERYLDSNTGDKLRLLRLPNTINEKSGLYKIQLSRDELAEMSAEEIKAMARSPRELRYADRTGLVPMHKEVAKVRKEAAELLERARERVTGRSERAIGVKVAINPIALAGEEEINAVCEACEGIPPGFRYPEQGSDWKEKGHSGYERLQLALRKVEPDLCDARKKMLAGGVEPGSRNNACVRLASALRKAGASMEETLAILLDWNQRIDPLDEREIRATVRSVFARSVPYDYGCNDPLIASFCPYRERRTDCRHYRIYRALRI